MRAETLPECDPLLFRAAGISDLKGCKPGVFKPERQIDPIKEGFPVAVKFTPIYIRRWWPQYRLVLFGDAAQRNPIHKCRLCIKLTQGNNLIIMLQIAEVAQLEIPTIKSESVNQAGRRGD